MHKQFAQMEHFALAGLPEGGEEEVETERGKFISPSPYSSLLLPHLAFPFRSYAYNTSIHPSGGEGIISSPSTEERKSITQTAWSLV